MALPTPFDADVQREVRPDGLVWFEVHGHLHAATAALDAAFSGTPTVMLDRDGWHVSSLHQLGAGRVVFADRESMWQACTEHWSCHGGVPGFGDWSNVLGELDPFRDGPAAERIGTYMERLVQGFKQGKRREADMANAAERYCRLWGEDKDRQVGRVKGGSGSDGPRDVSRHQ